MKIYKMCVLDGYKYIVDKKYNPELNRLLQSNGEINENIIYRCSISSSDPKAVLSDFNPAKIPIFSKRAYKELSPYINGDIYKPIKCVYGSNDSCLEEAYGIRVKEIDCLDYDNSKYKSIGENLIIVSRYVFNTQKIRDRLLFKIPKCPFVFVTDRFVKLVKDYKLVGFDFSLKYDGTALATKTITYHSENANPFWEYIDSLDVETTKSLQSNIIKGCELLGINELSSNYDVVKEIDRFVDSLSEEELDLSIPLGAVLGDVITKEYNWSWCVLGHDESSSFTVIKSPKNYYFIDPINILSKLIAKKRENNLIFLFNMLATVENNVPQIALEEIV